MALDIEDVMNDLGVSLDEKFDIYFAGERLRANLHFGYQNERDRQDNLITLINSDGFTEDRLIYIVLNWDVVIVKKQWRPLGDESFYYVGHDGYVYEMTNMTTFRSILILCGNCYQTSSQAEKYIDHWRCVYEIAPEFKEVEK